MVLGEQNCKLQKFKIKLKANNFYTSPKKDLLEI